MKFAEYVDQFLLCKNCKYDEKITTVTDISTFFQGITYFGAPASDQ